MNMLKKHLILIPSIAVILLLTLSLLIYVFIYDKGSSKSFSGTVEGVENCSVNIGSSKCTWIIDGKKVSWSWGSALDAQKTGSTDISPDGSSIGKEVTVEATKTGFNTYTIYKESESIKLIK